MIQIRYGTLCDGILSGIWPIPFPVAQDTIARHKKDKENKKEYTITGVFCDNVAAIQARQAPVPSSDETPRSA